MANINLLPWRETLRQKKQKNYLILLAITSACACLILLLMHFIYEYQISSQDSRNAYLKKEMLVVNAEIKEIKKLKEKKASMIERISLVRSLQNTRPVVVHLFDEIARSMPDDLYLTGLSLKGQRLTVNGVAKNNRLIAALIRQLDDSAWFANPNLSKIETLKSGESQFEISIFIERPPKKAKGGK